MRVMGVDLSTQSGYAVVDAEKGLLTSGVVTYPKLQGLPRVHAIVADLLAIKDKHSPDLLFIEDYALGLHIGAVVVQVEISTVLQFILWQDGITPNLVHPGKLKKFVAADGQAKKEMMLMHVFKRWGHTAKTNDECDAIGLAYFGLAANKHPINCTASMRLVIDEWRNPPAKTPKPRKKKT